MKYWVALDRVPYLGPIRFSRLEAHFGDLEHAWRAGPGELRDAGMESRVIKEMIAARDRVFPDDELEELHRKGVQAINWHDADYPARLKQIHGRPPVL